MHRLIHKEYIWIWLAVMVILFPRGSWAQEKVKWEQELRVDESQVPESARSVLASWTAADVHIRWYLERGKESLSYEAKFKEEKHRYSIEFDEQGMLEDIEVELGFKQLPDSIQSALCAGFRTIDKFKLKRIQAHWKQWPEPGELLRGRMEHNTPDLYELEFKAVIDGRLALWEGQFDLPGNLLSYREIILRSTDNIDL